MRVRERHASSSLGLRLSKTPSAARSWALLCWKTMTGTWVLSYFRLYFMALGVFLLLYVWVLSDFACEYAVIAAMHMGFKRCCL